MISNFVTAQVKNHPLTAVPTPTIVLSGPSSAVPTPPPTQQQLSTKTTTTTTTTTPHAD